MAKDQFGHLGWEDIRQSRIARLGIFNINLVHRRSAAGQRGRFVVVDTPDWVTIVPFVSRNPDIVYTVRQFRHGSGTITSEFPAGVVHGDEDPKVAAARELLEETGCRANELIHIGAVNPNPAFMNNRIHTFVALGLQKVQELELDDLELLELERTKLAEMYRRAGVDEYDNGILMIALKWLDRWSGSGSSGVS
jgi:8-oxo-dGTP pyrophosphatase MutT (NUDIX family)